MNKKIEAKQLSDDFKISDKELMILIESLFNMVKDNNKLINLNSARIKILEKGNLSEVKKELEEIKKG